MQQPCLDVLVIERACPLDERLARERAAREVRRQHELPRKLLRVQLPRPVDDHAADAAAQTVRVLPQRAQQAHEGLIRAVGVDRDGEQQPPPGGGRDLLRRKLRDREFRQRRGQQRQVARQAQVLIVPGQRRLPQRQQPQHKNEHRARQSAPRSGQGKAVVFGPHAAARPFLI